MEYKKNPKDLLDYVVAHEVIHLLEPSHGGRFVEILDKQYPARREARAELNDLPLGAESWS